MRFISVVPSQTELLHHLGLDAEVVGITKFCVHPQHWFRNKQRIGGTKNLNIAHIQQLQPDWVLANKEENVKEQIEAIKQFCQVYLSDVKDLADALQMIQDIGQLTNKTVAANDLCLHISRSILALPLVPKPQTTCYLIWQNPYMTVGGDTFIDAMLQMAGCQNVFHQQERYPSISIETIQALQPQNIFLSSEPYPFGEKQARALKAACPNANVRLVNGEAFSWYGSRLLHSLDYIKQLRQELFETA
jgi:ABC-type Fe3+-hydroxamate transport system substrate-binding protein